jgi:hypothetical protein
MLTRMFKGFIAVLVVAGALGGTSAAVATVSHHSSSVSPSAPAPAPRRRARQPRVEDGCRELPVAPVVPPPAASCS